MSNPSLPTLLAFLVACAIATGHEPLNPIPPDIPVTKENVGQTWSMSTAPDARGRFFYCQRTFDKDGEIKGFISCREFVEKPKYKEVGRILIFGRWNLSDGVLTTEATQYLPAHAELPSADTRWIVDKLTVETMVLSNEKKDRVTLTKTVLGKDPNKVGSGEVQFYTEQVPTLGL